MSGFVLRHLALPALAPASMVALYFTPVSVFGCVNRGLMAVGVALVAAVAATVTTYAGVRARSQGDAAQQRWMLTTLILLLTVALLVGLG